MIEIVPNNLGLTERELCEAVTMWVRHMGKPLVATRFAGTSISGRGSYDFEITRLTQEKQHYDHETDTEVLRLVRLNKVIEAIKYYRARSGSGLKEAKDHVDRVIRDNGM